MKTISRHTVDRPPDTLTRQGVRLLGNVLAVLLLATSGAFAQQGVQIGFSAAYEFGLDPASSRSAAFSNWCNCSENGSRLGHAGWIGLSLSHASLFGETFGLASSLRYGSYSSIFVGSLPVQSPAGTTFEFQENSHASLLQFDLAGTMRLNNQVVITLGPTFDLPLSITSSALERERSDEGSIVDSSERPLTLPDSDGGRGEEYGAILRGEMEIPVGGSVTLVPSMYATFNFNRLSEGSAFGAVMIGGGTSLMFDVDRLFLPTPPTPVPLPPKPMPVVEKAPPTASITLFAVDRNGNRSDRAVIHPLRERHLRQMPAPAIFVFLEQSQEFARPYRLDHRAIGGAIALDSLAYLGAEEVALQGLNITGSRLREHPAARITLIAVTARNEPTALGVARAKKIRSYLSERWGIQEKRIAIRTISARHGESVTPVVQITSSSAEVLAPVEAEWIVERFSAPRISMRRDIHAEAGVRRWKLDVHCGSRIVSSSSSDSTQQASPSIEFDLSNYSAGTALEPLVARLVVEDSAGAIITASDDLEITIEQKPEGGTIAEQLRYILPADLISRAAKRSALARSLVPVIRPGAEITISIYRGSEQSENDIELFAAELRRLLGARNVVVRLEEGTGEFLPGYDYEVAVLQRAPEES